MNVLKCSTGTRTLQHPERGAPAEPAISDRATYPPCDFTKRCRSWRASSKSLTNNLTSAVYLILRGIEAGAALHPPADVRWLESAVLFGVGEETSKESPGSAGGVAWPVTLAS